MEILIGWWVLVTLVITGAILFGERIAEADRKRNP